jgi:hypothetical protein
LLCRTIIDESIPKFEEDAQGRMRRPRSEVDYQHDEYNEILGSVRQKKHIQRSKAQHSTTQHNTAQHSTTQHNTTQHSIAQHNTVQHSTAHVNADTQTRAAIET